MAHPSLRFFARKQLPPELAAISEPFGDLAHQMARRLPENEQSRLMMHYLLLAKDCGVRAALPDDPPSSQSPSLPSLPIPPSPFSAVFRDD